MARKWSLFLLVLLLLGGGAAFAWQVALNRLERGVLAWAEARRAEGWQVAHGAPERGPLPWRPEVALPGFSARNPLGLGLEAGTLRVALDPRTPRHLRLRAEGELAALAGAQRVPVQAQALEGLAGLEAEDLLWNAEALVAPGLESRRIALRWRDGHAQLTADATRLGPVRLDGFSLLLALENPAGTPAAFRAGGGRLRLLQAEARRGEARAEAQATLTLDAALQPEGRGQLTLHAPGDWVAAMREAGLLAPQVAGPLAIAAQLGARVPPGGGPPRLEMPVELRARRLSVARFPVANLPEVAWR
ncbi:DUF2125 domain-containing protein [Roseococcus sp. DSY-14]|uniref:DUF2125 domain-containing protein n=1 Tax=Roseococcus sp. DSY-14 TaxID=3369650 RepID=UPI00387ABE38